MGLLDKFFSKNQSQSEQTDTADAKAVEAAAQNASDAITDEENYMPDIPPEYVRMLHAYAVRFISGDINSIATQKSMLDAAAKVIPAIASENLPFGLQRVFNTNELHDFNIMQFQSRIGIEVNSLLSDADFETITEGFAQFDNDEMCKAWVTFDFYCYMLKPEFSQNIKKLYAAMTREIKNRGLEFKVKPISQFEALQMRCHAAIKEAPDAEETAQFKKQLGEQLLELDAIWAAYDGDFIDTYPYIGLMGTMELFTQEEYALKAKEHFAGVGEGNFVVRKIAKNDIKKFFDDALYLGAVRFNLDNGVRNITLNIEDFYPYDDEHRLDKKNRFMRCALIRHIECLCRYQKLSDAQKTENVSKLYQNVSNALLSNAFTMVANGIFYVVTDGSYAESTTVYSRKAYDRIKQYLDSKNADTASLIAESDTKYDTFEVFSGLHTMQYPDRGTFAPVFTDKAGAEKMKAEFEKRGGKFDCAVVAITFEELLGHLLQCDGVVIDTHSYGYIIRKEQLEEIKRQMFAKQENDN